MTKTLVALYETVTTAAQVVQELIADDFARNDIHLALDHTTSHAVHNAIGVQEAAYEGAHVVETLADLGVPYDEAYAYTEGVRRGGALVVVESSEERAERGMAILQRLHPVNIHERTTQWQQEGWTGAEAHARTATAPATATPSPQERPRAPQGGTDDTEVRIPVVQEDISVGTREVERGHVHISSRVTEHPVEEAVRLREEKVTVERRPDHRPATDADIAAAGKEIIEMTETAEEPVVSKRARVVEEVVVQKEVAEHTETVRGTARHTEVDVQRAPEDAAATRQTPASQGFAAYDATFREHYTTAFATSGAAYAVYEPAYRYGYELGTNEHSRGRDWAALEAEARRDWEARHPSTWERFKDAVRYGWNSVRTRT
jgi:stress response protein YsnF